MPRFSHITAEDRTGSAPRFAIINPATKRDHLVPSSREDHDTLGSMTNRSQPSILKLQILQQTAVLARVDGLLFCLSAAERLAGFLHIALQTAKIHSNIYTVLIDHCRFFTLCCTGLASLQTTFAPLFPLCCSFAALCCLGRYSRHTASLCHIAFRLKTCLVLSASRALVPAALARGRAIE